MSIVFDNVPGTQLIPDLMWYRFPEGSPPTCPAPADGSEGTNLTGCPLSGRRAVCRRMALYLIKAAGETVKDGNSIEWKTAKKGAACAAEMVGLCCSRRSVSPPFRAATA